jgi:hypothetical protein
LLEGDIERADERFSHAFALACQLGDPCWEAMARRGLGRVAIARGNLDGAEGATQILVDSMARCVRLPDGYLWCKAYALDTLCGLAVAHGMLQAPAWIDELQRLSDRNGMRELTARAHLHRAATGDSASATAARWLAGQIDNPVLQARAHANDNGATQAPSVAIARTGS